MCHGPPNELSEDWNWTEIDEDADYESTWFYLNLE